MCKDVPLVEVEWVDVMSYNGLIDIEDVTSLEPTNMRIVGYLVGETEHEYYIAKEVWGSGQCKYVSLVPKTSAIRSIKKLEYSVFEENSTLLEDVRNKENIQSYLKTLLTQRDEIDLLKEKLKIIKDKQNPDMVEEVDDELEDDE